MLGLKVFVPVQTRNFCHSAVRFIIYLTISIFQAFFSPISSAIKLKVFCVQKARGKCFFPKTTLPHRLLLQEISKFEWEKPECWRLWKTWILRLWMVVASKSGVENLSTSSITIYSREKFQQFSEGFKWNADFVFFLFVLSPFLTTLTSVTFMVDI